MNLSNCKNIPSYFFMEEETELKLLFTTYICSDLILSLPSPPGHFPALNINKKFFCPIQDKGNKHKQE